MKHLHFLLLLLVISLFGSNASAQTDLNELMHSRNEYYFSLKLSQAKDIQKINKIVSVDATNGESVICYANNKQYEKLLGLGYKPTLLTPPSMKEQPVMYDGTSRETYEWDSYPTYSEYETMMYGFATNHPDNCSIIELGTLSSGRKILVAHLHNGSTDGKPRFLYVSSIHGDETTGYVMMLRLIDYLLSSTNTQAMNIMNNIDVYICPLHNPDGTYHGGNNTVYGATRGNANGIDLNRHFPDFIEGPHPDGESHYQDEAQWFMNFAQEHLFTMSANYHGGAEVLNYPWDTYQPLCADDAWWQYVCREYADLVHAVNANYMTDLNNGITNGYAWYSIGGGRQDYMNYYQQCREVTIECSSDKTPSASSLPNFWNYNVNGMLTYMEECLYGIHGTVTDSITGQPIVATITISGHDNNGSSVTSHMPAGDYHRPIKAGTYNVLYTAEGYCPKSYTITVNDHQTVVQNVQLVSGNCLLPDFSASMTDVPINGSVNFTDQSWGDVTAWSWQFEGGSPATSTSENPSGITYAEAGHYDVTLTITNSNGESATVTKENYINVSESYNMQNGTITTCDALFFDYGGANGNYNNNEDLTMTFMPLQNNHSIRVTFNQFSTESNYDKLYIYNGASTSAPSIGTYSGSTSPGTVTADNEQGALTFRFTSDGSSVSSGWSATVACISNDPLAITVTATPETINEGETSQLQVTATGGAGGYTYLWTPTTTLDNPNIANPVATPVEAHTTYQVTVTDADGETASGEVTVNIRDLSAYESMFEDFRIYPNPSKGVIYIESSTLTGKLQYSLVNSLGQKVLSHQSESFKGKEQIDMEGLAKGIYFIHLSTDEGTMTRKVVVE